MEVRELVTKLGFEVDEEKLKAIERGVESMKHGLEAIVGLEGSVAATFFELTKSTSEYGEDIKRNALITNLSYAAYQKYRFAAEQAGVSNEEFTIGIRYLNRAAGEAILNIGRFPEVFKKMGISQSDLRGKNLDMVLPKIADYFKVNKDISAALGMEMFGRGGALMSSWLSRGAQDLQTYTDKAQALGVMTDENVEAAENFEKAEKSLFYTITQTRNEIGVKLFPIVQGIIEKIQAWWIANKKIIDQDLNGFMKILSSVASTAWWWLVKISDVAFWLTSALGGVANAAFLVATALAAIGGARVIMALNAVVVMLEAVKDAQWAALGASVLRFGMIAGMISVVLILLQDFWTALSGGSSIFDGLINAVSSFFETFDDWIDKVTGKIKTAFSNAWTFVWSSIVSAYHDIVPEWMQRIFQGAANLIGDVARFEVAPLAPLFQGAVPYNAGAGFFGMPANAPAASPRLGPWNQAARYYSPLNPTAHVVVHVQTSGGDTAAGLAERLSPVVRKAMQDAHASTLSQGRKDEP